jgi:spermidine synthase
MSRTAILYLNVFVIATCGLIYELLAGTLASYLLGDSVTQFSTCIGVYLFALGVGAWLSGFLDKSLARYFVEVELAVALLGGFSAPLLFLSFASLQFFSVVLYCMILAIGTLVGLELPLLMRILREDLDFKHLVSRVLTFDYVGCLLASLLFPIFLVPDLGLVRTSLTFGICNAVVGLWGTWVLESGLGGGVIFLRIRGVLVIVLLVAGFIKADSFTTWSEDQLYSDAVVYSQTSRYQRIVLTQRASGFQLWLDGNLQFSSRDEYRYHEALVHPAAMLAQRPKRVLVLGGGDGLALREILKYDTVKHVTLVDLDPAMTGLAARFPPLDELNGGAFRDSRVRVVNADAMIWMEQPTEPFDLVIIDFPDPNNFSLGKLYTRRFYRQLRSCLAKDAAVAIQCTSPLEAPRSFWCIVNTLQSAGFSVLPYRVSVPSFGVWGFALAQLKPFAVPQGCRGDLHFLNDHVVEALFQLPNDMQQVATEINRLDNQILVYYYDREWEIVR